MNSISEPDSRSLPSGGLNETVAPAACLVTDKLEKASPADSTSLKSTTGNNGKEDWTRWTWQYRNRIKDGTQLTKYLKLTVEEKRAIQFSHSRLRMAITPHFVSLMDPEDSECPIRRQAIPSLDEFRSSINDLTDPCGEEKDTVVPGLVHRYPDRVLLLLTDACAAYCRHCTRRRMVGSNESTLTTPELENIFTYLKTNKTVRDVLISGGDPFLLPDNRLEEILRRLRAIPHIEIIRFGTRLPVFLPYRFDDKLCQMLKKYHPLYINIHFNHPKEISSETKLACARLAETGIPLGSQTVLLKGVNDSAKVMMKLVQELVKIRVRPYYLYQCDLATGTEHFRTSVATGIKIVSSLRGFTSGFAVPTYVIDAPGGGGKVPISPDYVISRTRKGVIFRNYQGNTYFYPEKTTIQGLENVVTSSIVQKNNVT